jgi:glycine cleavage system H protein
VADTPTDLRYTKEHEYVKQSDDDGVVIVGITDFAQSELGDIVYVELPTAGDTVTANEVFGTVEAVKAVSELFSPLSGEVVEVNDRLDQEPNLVNSDPYGDGWMLKIRLTNPEEMDSLMSAEDYMAHTGE